MLNELTYWSYWSGGSIFSRRRPSSWPQAASAPPSWNTLSNVARERVPVASRHMVCATRPREVDLATQPRSRPLSLILFSSTDPSSWLLS